ncbi:MAG: MBOAT family protein [Sphingomonadales bacterium]|nr:MBOAT family protein [Sphingomonadales bacterium]
MAFNTSLFILVFVVFYCLYVPLAGKPGLRTALLFIFNSVFYYLLSSFGLGILLALSVADFFLAKGIFTTRSENSKRFFLWISILLNIGLILTFRHFSQWFGFREIPFWPATIGVSFYVFRSLGYVLDVFHENIETPETSWFRYFTYLSFFPLMLQGPISPARDFLPELRKGFSAKEVPSGEAFFFLISGIIKKYALAAYITANFTERVFGSPHLFTGMENLFAAIGQALVIFLDFSGYTDMMLGMGLLLGFRLSENFNFPYASANITEYWRRWHMSLSKWLNEYLFFPLSFTLRRWKKWGTVLAVMITFVISGFWHGTSLNYTLWGALHGLALSWDIASSGIRDKIKNGVPMWIYHPISVALTFLFLALSGIYFKLEDMEIATGMLSHIFTDRDWSVFGNWLHDFGGVFAVMCGVLLWQWSAGNVYPKIRQIFIGSGWFMHAILLVLAIFLAYQISGMEPIPFIYQKF